MCDVYWHASVPVTVSAGMLMSNKGQEWNVEIQVAAEQFLRPCENWDTSKHWCL